MKILKTLAWAYIAVTAMSLSASAADLKQVEQSLASKYVGQTLALRNFYTANRLRYSETGILSGPRETGTWTLYSTVEVKKIALASHTLHVEGLRRAFVYDAQTKQFDESRTDLPISIDLEYPPGVVSQAVVEKAMTNVFIAPGEKLADELPPFWQSFFQEQQAAKDQNTEPKCSTPPGVLRKGDGASVPRLLSKVDPVYTDVARRGKIEGSVILCVVVQHDGTIGSVQLFQPLGLGLDESAVDAVRKWRFQPGTKDGNPVDVLATVEVSFRLVRK
jgi:TonB family protein